MIKRDSGILSYKAKSNSCLIDVTSNSSMLDKNAFRNNKSKKYILKNYKTGKNKKRANSSMHSSLHTYISNNSKFCSHENNPTYLEVSNLKKQNSKIKQYKINPLNYNNNTNNSIIRNYSPKITHKNMISIKKIHLNTNPSLQVFSEYEIIELFINKCKDLAVPVQEELLNRFMNFVKEKCVNRIIDLSDCFLGFNSMIVLSELLNKNNDMCSRVVLTKNNFGDVGIQLLIENIQNNNNIVELNLSSNNIGVKGGITIFNYLLNQNSIISLDLSSKEGIYRNRICAEGVKLIEKVLQNNLYLEKIDLSWNSLKNEGLKYIVNGLIKNSTLQTLILSNNEINEKGMSYMESKIYSCKLKHLDLSYNPISNQGLILLGNCLYVKKLNEISYLNLSECSFNFNAFKPFIKKLSKNHKLLTLILNKNNLYSNKWDTIDDAFKGMALKHLSLGSCELGPAIKNIAHIFIRNATLKYIDFSHNKISDKEFEYFKDYPLNNLSLEEIDFSNNFISDKSAATFFRNLSYSNNIQRLNFYDNQLQNESANAILEAVKKNINLFNINIKCNRIGIKMIKEINSYIINNKMIEKSKYLPKLKEELKGLEFNPMEITNLKDRIIYLHKEREYLSKKFSQDIKEFGLRKKKNLEEVKNIENDFLGIQNEIESCEKKLKYITEEINNENENLYKNIKIFKEKKKLIEKEIKEIKNKQNIIKFEQEEEISLLRDTYQNTYKQEQQMKISISSLTKQLENNKKKLNQKRIYLERLKIAKIDMEEKSKANMRATMTIKKFNRNNSKNIKDSAFTSFQTKKKKEKNEENNTISIFGKKRTKSHNIKVKLKNKLEN